MDKEIHFEKNQCQCKCFRHVQNICWKHLEKYFELGFTFNPNHSIHQDTINKLFDIQDQLYRITSNVEARKLLYLCADVIADHNELNVELLPKSLQAICTLESAFSRRLWYWSKEWDIPVYFHAHIGYKIIKDNN